MGLFHHYLAIVEIQYARNDTDFHRGTFRARGDVIEIFPASSDAISVRIELFGDIVDAIHEIDPLTGKSLKPAVLDRAWTKLTFTDDPIASSLRQSAAAALALGFISSSDLANIYDLTLLNKVLTAQGKQAISTA